MPRAVFEQAGVMLAFLRSEWRPQQTRSSLHTGREKYTVRIAAYYPWIYLTSGVERTILEMCRRSRHEYTLFTNHFEPENTFPGLSDVPVVELRRVSVERGLFPVFRAASTIALQELKLSSFDSLLIHCDGLGDLALARPPKLPVACFCHTPLRPVFDSCYRDRAIAKYKGTRRQLFNGFAAAFRKIDQALWSRYSYAFFNSHETLSRAEKGGLLERLGNRCEVLHPGIDWAGLEPTWIYKSYFLVPGRIMWTKNIELALAAFIRWKDSSHLRKEFRLVVAGRVDKKSESYLTSLRALANERGDIEFVISPSDAQLNDLYANCTAVLFPSFNEDWGIVPLEANAFGKPVISSNRGGPLESQVDGQTGFLADPDPGAFSEAMTRLLADMGTLRHMGMAARNHSRKYDWSEFVARTDQVLDGLVANRAESKGQVRSRNGHG